ncbi:MAG: PAS domain-containing sensor histidine kinase [Desulfuromonas sp.]|nr:MAG: PAS domain-containing sensor histidine kinase [Desulfuromonas sp.]
MRPRRLISQLFPTYLLILIFSVGGISWFSTSALRDFHLQSTRDNLLEQGRVFRAQISNLFFTDDRESLLGWANRVTGIGTTRITLILPDGTVVGDSDENPLFMENHASRPEIQSALDKKDGSSLRYSHTLQKEMLYVAQSVEDESGTVVGIVRTAKALETIDEALHMLYSRIAFGGGLAVFLAALLSWGMARHISLPLARLRQGAERFARGELKRRLAVRGSGELQALAATMNQMAGQLDDRIKMVVQQRNEQNTMLASMVEGVLAVDHDQSIVRLNRAAGELLGIDPELAQGRPFAEVSRRAELQRFVDHVMASDEPIETDLVLRQAQAERFLQAHGTTLADDKGDRSGALIVLHDVTRLRRLEQVRRDFVANASHELKTPVTAIKGYSETLLDSGISEEDRARFLGVIVRQADRLQAIIDDLLVLSRLDGNTEGKPLPLEEVELRPILDAAQQDCAVAAESRGIRFKVEAPPLHMKVNSPLLEQAVVNLLTNAIKFSPLDAEVEIEVAKKAHCVTIAVTDHGCGIASKHLPRLFERFYRVDPSRSRMQGGTGLGLSIVQNICKAHGGEVEVKSALGKGSTFTISLPSS